MKNNCKALDNLVQEVTGGLDTIENAKKTDKSLSETHPVNETCHKDCDVSPALLGAMRQLYEKLDCVLFNNTPRTSKPEQTCKT